MHSFAPKTSLISPANHFSVDVIDLESDSESDTEDEDARTRYDLPLPAPGVGGVRLQRSGLGDCLAAADVPALFVCLSIGLIGATAGSALCCGIATPPVLSANSFWYSDTVPCNTLDFDIGNSFSLDSDNLDNFNLDSDYLDISNLDFEIENTNYYNFCGLCTVDHFQSG
ncbi:hypothetical protein CYMTET_15102 [Cymbomonas tetramitiformis]|uniref:Uncharacterized protein n=1 Tax=Cymbomonas tetramitiformis TaxID=36881 RepID=A0AAE0L9C8_9CHLO|nr:hypothetical protein CYMTET_15102 [Cymbomonas tetramitiformis]